MNSFTLKNGVCLLSQENKRISMAFPYRTINDFISVKPAS